MFNAKQGQGPKLSGPEIMIRSMVGAETYDAMKQMAQSGAMNKFLVFVEEAGSFKLRLERIESQLSVLTQEIRNGNTERRIQQDSGQVQQPDVEPGSNSSLAIGHTDRHTGDDDEASAAGRYAGPYSVRDAAGGHR